MKIAGATNKVKETIKTVNSKKSTGSFRMSIRSRHPSHDVIREWAKSTASPRFADRVIVRLGSEFVPSDGLKRTEINTVDAIRTSSDKELSKIAFNKAKVPTADAYVYQKGGFHAINSKGISSTKTVLKADDFPMIGKLKRGSRGNGLVLFETLDELNSFIGNFTFYRDQMGLSTGIGISSYMFEKYHNYSREYRIHLGPNGVIYTNRKMLKSDTADDQRFYRNDKNSVWYLETNPKFDKPVNWNNIIKDCQKAREAVGLDICAIDLRIQSAKYKGKKRKDPKYFIVEINSAPSHGEGTAKAYMKALPEIIKLKQNK